MIASYQTCFINIVQIVFIIVFHDLAGFQASIKAYNINPLSGGGTSKPATTNLTLNTLVKETPVVEKFIG